MNRIHFTDGNGSFQIRNPENTSYLYFPIAGDKGLKSALTPDLGGDSKIDQNTFLLEPVSTENLHNNKSGRNFWVRVKGKGSWSVCGRSAEQEAAKFTDEQDESEVEAGFMWHVLKRSSGKYSLRSEATSFVTIDGKMEVLLVEIENISSAPQTVTPIAAIPIYGRSADNIRDHRHVTSLLHRIHTTESGVEVTPTLSFDERGHQKNSLTYFVSGFTGNGEAPVSVYPTVELFLGEGGSFFRPEAVRIEKQGVPSDTSIEGKEACGAFAFRELTLAPFEKASYCVLFGIAEKGESVSELTGRLCTKEKIKEELTGLKCFWNEKVNVSFRTGDAQTDGYLKWICFQPILRRIYGCSFLPYHDYGKGGRGWRDLWQDCLALLIMEPDGVRQMILDNYCGVRMDGTNATIIGSRQGEFIADRNNITRVWMDHAFWPFVTTRFYIDQSGDIEILNEKVSYFKDRQVMRGTAHDDDWARMGVNRQQTAKNTMYEGSILEHILLQNLCAFYDVGEHNELLLHGADWNDALDMAAVRGESVAFTCAYAGNLKNIAECLNLLAEKTGQTTLSIAKEMEVLLAGTPDLYESIEGKKALLSSYCSSCSSVISGEQITLPIAEVSAKLKEMASWLMEHIRRNEWLNEGWFNGYYDNNGRKVEGRNGDDIRMMLTGQVFAVMSGTATEDQIRDICKNADTYLFDKTAGGYRLNTDFHEVKDDLGRMFGFAYGEKENGAVFSHMTVMFANALYSRGFVPEAHKALQTLLDTAMDFSAGKMYPGIPEYYNSEGRGMYPYLTGAASWYMMTMVNQIFGVRGTCGDLTIAPKLMRSRFDEQGHAEISLKFGGKKFKICFENPEKKDWNEFSVAKVSAGDLPVSIDTASSVSLKKEEIAKLDPEKIYTIQIDMK